MTDKLHKFYCSKAWRDLVHALKKDAGGKCNRCDYIAIKKEDFKNLIGHHKIILTESNVDNPNISLNPDNIEIICHDCHNKEHRRFGNKKSVYIVYGSPLSGKTELVNNIKEYGDIILDIDELWKAVTLEDKYIKPNNLRFNVFKIRDEILDQIKRRYGDWYNAYIIGGYPDKYERERLSKELGAEIIYCESTKEECLNRIGERPKEWERYVLEWWERFER